MIEIPCRVCGYMLEVPQELAGTPVQCPHCHLLSDIPSLSELKQINADGTYVMDASTRTEDPYRLGEMVHVFGKNKLDHEGRQIDLRGPASPEEDSYKLASEPDPELRPKYDPETGELIRPLEMIHDPARERIDPASIPMARPALGYASPSTKPPISTRSIFVNLLRPTNLLVMLLLYILYIMIGVMIRFCGSLNYILGIPFLLIFVLMLIGHWANVIDEVGRQERDELPRPFRDMQWYDDMCQPLAALGLAMFVCYMPLRIVLWTVSDPHVAMLVGLPFALAATFFFPAVFLITSTSGTIVNLRPDRVWGTVLASGGAYPMAVLLWTLAGTAYNYCLSMLLLAALPSWTTIPSILRDWRVLFGVLAAAIYLMHYFCWTMGLIYRERHASLPWAFQFHQRTREEDAAAARANKRPLRIKATMRLPEPPPPVAQPQAGNWPEIRE